MKKNNSTAAKTTTVRCEQLQAKDDPESTDLFT